MIFFPCILKCCTLFVELGGSRIENKGRLVGRGAEARSPPLAGCEIPHMCCSVCSDEFVCFLKDLSRTSIGVAGMQCLRLECSALCLSVSDFIWNYCTCIICVCSTCNESFKQRGREGRRSGSVGQQWSRLRLGTHLG